jgi:methionyl aminopeptidase
MKEAVRAGVTTAELDAIGEAVLRQHGARSAPRLVYQFPGANCISVNEEAVHGIPGERVLGPGDLVKLDVTAELDGYYADACVTAAVAPVSKRKEQLAACAEAALAKAIGAARAGRPMYEIGRAVQAEVSARGFAVIPQLCGHGVGRTIHEEPRTVLNYEDRRVNGQRLAEGTVLTIEPIIAAGSPKIVTEDDGWTIRTVDRSPTAHAEHTLVITKDRPLILTRI